jgi:hypothetical protein
MSDVVRYVRIRNWERFQHYRDRRPPWIKLHQSLADDFAFHELPDHAKVQLMSLWILASKHDNKIPDRGVGFERHNLSHRPFDIPLLVKAGFLEYAEEETGITPANVNASKMLSLARSQESEAEGEVYSEGRTKRTSWYRRLG